MRRDVPHGTYPNRIREIRDEQKLSRHEVARGVDLHPVTVYRHESGRMRMERETAERYATLFGVEVSEIFYEEPNAATG